MKLLTKEEQKSYENKKKSVIFVNTNLKANIWKVKNILQLQIIVIIWENIEVLHIAYVIINIVPLKNSYSFS